MKIIFLIVFLAINGISAGRRKRMVGGAPITIEEAPYFVSIRYNCLHICGGSLITLQHVLTAGHCVPYSMRRVKEFKMMVVVGSDKRNAGGICHTIEDIITSSYYCGDNLRDDVAVIKLLERVRPSATTNIIPLPTKKLEYYNHGILVGFRTAKDRYKVVQLHQMKVSLRPAENCWLRVPDSSYKNEGQFCAIILRHGEHTYGGDSGGPLVYNGEVVGIASWHSIVGHKDSFYTDVFLNLDFIRNATKI